MDPIGNKNRTFDYYTILKDRICHKIFSRLESSSIIGFDYDGSIVLFDNSGTHMIRGINVH